MPNLGVPAGLPFPDQTPRRFTKAEIDALEVDLRGCYGLFRAGLLGTPTCLYVGQGNIRDRLVSHLNGGNPRITQQGPTHFMVEVLARRLGLLGDALLRFDAREQQLIQYYSPICNEQHR